MPLTKVFKILIIAMFVVGIIEISVAEFLFDTLPMPLQKHIMLVENEPFDGNTTLTELTSIFIGGLTIIIFTIASIIGIWKFKNWARYLYLITTILFLPIYFITGPVIMNPAEAMFSSIAYSIDGALIALMFLSPLSKEFKLNTNKNDETNNLP